jgi:glycolate oxidase FAD binding subunit
MVSVEELAREGGFSGSMMGDTGHGVLWAGFRGGDAAGLVRLVEKLRERLREEGGVVVERAPSDWKSGLDVWGATPGLSLMKRLKQELDPYGILSPGRFVGGI